MLLFFTLQYFPTATRETIWINFPFKLSFTTTERWWIAKLLYDNCDPILILPTLTIVARNNVAILIQATFDLSVTHKMSHIYTTTEPITALLVFPHALLVTAVKCPYCLPASTEQDLHNPESDYDTSSESST